jgi:hypothetical protein
MGSLLNSYANIKRYPYWKQLPLLPAATQKCGGGADETA